MWTFDLPLREITWWSWFAMRVLYGLWVVIVLTILPSFEQRVWVIETPRTSNKSLPISGFNPSLTATNSESSIRHPLLFIGACIMPMTGIGSLAKVLSSCAGADVSHRARVELFITSVAWDSFKMLHTLPESMRSPTVVFPICKNRSFGFNLDCVASNASYHIIIWTMIVGFTLRIIIGILDRIDRLFSCIFLNGINIRTSSFSGWRLRLTTYTWKVVL